MARGIRYTREFQEKALRLLGESRANHSSETKALASVSQSLGIACFASMFVRQVRQCFSVVWADGFPRCRHRFPVM